MELKIRVPFVCPDNIRPFLEKVFQGEYEMGVHIPRGGKILDLGANYGAFAIWAAHRWPGTLIESFEPHPEVYKGCLKNVAAYEEIRVHNWGIGDEGVRILNDGPNNDGERSFHGILNGKNLGGTECIVKDPLTLPECDLLKMDIEGCEMEVLIPLIRSGRRPAAIVLEYHNNKLRRDVDRLLSDYEMIGGEMTTPLGLGIAKYLRGDIFAGVLAEITHKDKN
jgi:FkbM family methyltransferase